MNRSEWPDGVHSREVAPAYVTPFSRGSLRTRETPRLWMAGAVHDDAGALVAESQRWWSSDNPNAPVAADPDFRRPPAQCDRLSGTHLYVGHWTNHFGHFLVEVLPRLWPAPGDPSVDGLVAHRSFRGKIRRAPSRSPSGPVEPSRWQSDLLTLAGYGDLPVHVVRSRSAKVDRLVVPASPVIFRTHAAPEAVDVWTRVAEAVADPGAHPRVYLSRSRFNRANDISHRRSSEDPAWDEWLDVTFADAGYEVAFPEEIGVEEQVRLMKGASVVVGPSGSALHLSVFASTGTDVVEIGDTRSPHAIQSSQRMVNDACGHRSHFVPYLDKDAVGRLIEQLS